MAASLRLRIVRTTAVAVCLVAGSWVVGSCREAGWGNSETTFHWLLQRDGRLLVATDDPSWLDRLTIAWRLKRLDRAYRSFIENHPTHARAKLAYGCFLYDHGRRQPARQMWQAAIATDPNLAVAYNNLAEDFAHHGNAEEAIRYYDRALELAPGRALFHFNRALVVSQYRREAARVYGWDRAEVLAQGQEGFRRARDLAPTDLFYARSYAEGFIYLATPDWEGAYAAWKFCLPIIGNDQLERQRIYAKLARVCQRLQRFDEAESWLEKITRAEVTPLRARLEAKQEALLAGQPDRLPVTMRVDTNQADGQSE